MENCIFCKIIKRELPSYIIYEDDDVLSFITIQPITRGHSLTIPKKHFEDIMETPAEDLGRVVNVVKKVAAAIMKAFNTDSFTITTNRGDASHRTIRHLHFHVIPRYSNDGLKDWPHEEIEVKTRKEIAELIKKAL